MKDLLDYANKLDYFEDEEIESQKPNTMHLRENSKLPPRASRLIPLGQSAHCAWFLTKGIHTA